MITQSGQSIDEHPPESDRFLAHHFESHDQQLDATKLGMWLFLASEILFFGGLFVAYGILRHLHPDAFRDASSLLDVNLGTLNTVILLLSSLTMALAVRAAQLRSTKSLIINLVLTLVCASAFLVVKAVEYHHKIEDGYLWASRFEPLHHDDEAPKDESSMMDRKATFFSVYYAMTGLHGLHIVAGMGAIGWLLVRSFQGDFSAGYFGPVEAVGLYWHLVDLVWIFLFPLLYLVN